MKIYRSIDDIEGHLENPVITIGNFDGVHLGHREIFRKIKKDAVAIGGVSVVITFIPHPLKVIGAGRTIRLINTYDEKETLIEASGIDYLITIPFTPEFAATSAEEFVQEVLVGRLGMRKLVIGYDYSFGRGREGNALLLSRLGGEFGFAVEVLEPITTGQTVYSSTLIREMISDGDMRGVVPLLGRHFSVGGRVIHGYHRGKGLGFPTANIETSKELLPKPGVYAVKVKIDERIYDGACNIGTNPTFGNELQSVEVFVFDFDGDLYGSELRIYFVDRVRDEQRYPDVSALQEAISTDIRRCREILQNVSIIEYREYLEEV